MLLLSVLSVYVLYYQCFRAIHEIMFEIRNIALIVNNRQWLNSITLPRFQMRISEILKTDREQDRIEPMLM